MSGVFSRSNPDGVDLAVREVVDNSERTIRAAFS
jgi:hypothetical protein